VADTNRFNRDTGLPKVQRSTGQPLPNARQNLGFVRLGVRLAWEEEPFEWLRPQRFGVRRRYRAGPVALLEVEVDLESRAEGGTRLIYVTRARPRNLLGIIAIPLGIGIYSRLTFGAAFRRYDALAGRSRPEVALGPSLQLTPGGEARLADLRARLTKQTGHPDVANRLTDFVVRGDDISLAHLRPYALADAWGVPRRIVLETCLYATRAGLLDLQWDLLCPLCRGAKASHSALAEMSGTVHCDTCNIDFGASFDRSVELTFRPNPMIRHVEVDGYCVGSPLLTPHVVVQQLLKAGERREVAVQLEPGRYRARTLGPTGGQFFAVVPDGAPGLAVRADPEDWPNGETMLAPSPTLRFENATEAEQLFIVERTRWNDQAVTAAEVTTLQVFRDLFSNEILRRGEQISVGSLTILFTDLRDSTNMYRQVGDAPAFGRVLDHFAVFREEIAREDGALVKTIGDAVMGVFRRPSSALRAILAAQQRLANAPDGSPPLAVKAGLHHGPCIAVTLNDRLDYFGSTVNLASRLERFSTGADVIISDVVRDDPEVAEILSSAKLAVESFLAKLKGFDDEELRLWRVTPN
jgi:class 3 adenylate cyclase